MGRGGCVSAPRPESYGVGRLLDRRTLLFLVLALWIGVLMGVLTAPFWDRPELGPALRRLATLSFAGALLGWLEPRHAWRWGAAISLGTILALLAFESPSSLMAEGGIPVMILAAVAGSYVGAACRAVGRAVGAVVFLEGVAVFWAGLAAVQAWGGIGLVEFVLRFFLLYPLLAAALAVVTERVQDTRGELRARWMAALAFVLGFAATPIFVAILPLGETGVRLEMWALATFATVAGGAMAFLVPRHAWRWPLALGLGSVAHGLLFEAGNPGFDFGLPALFGMVGAYAAVAVRALAVEAEAEGG